MSVDYSVQKGSTAPMAQDADIYRNGPGRGNTVITDISAPYCLETAYGYQLDLDFLKYVEDIQSGSTIKRLNLKRRPRVADSVAEPQSGATPSQWTSSESLSSASSDDTRHSAMFSVSRGRPPLPPPHGTSSNSTTTSSHDGPSVSQKSQEGKPLPAVRSLTSPRYNALVEKTLMETRRRLEQEKTIPPQPEPHPRRRLASFGGVGSSGSLSPFTGWGAYNQNNNGNKPSAGELSLHMSSSLGSGGSGGSLRPSPQSSGRATPVTGLSPLHLQHIRDQMVVALQRLKEMEDQVKTIPVLQVKISVLQEEKRQLVSQMKNQNNNQDLSDMFRKRAHSTGSSERFKKLSEDGKVGKTEDKMESALHSAASGLKEFRQLSAEMEALERTIKGGRLQARRGLTQNTLHDSAYKFVTEAIDEDLEAVLTRSSKHCRDVGVETKPIETRCIATGVSEAHLGVTFDGEVELETQQRIIEALKDRVCQLEAELKESTLQKEMGRLRLELQAAGARNRADKGSTARPSTNSTATEARPQTRSLGVGNHMEVQDACTGRRVEAEGCSVGVSCRPEQRSVSTGPDVPMIQWEVRKRVESRDQCVGRRLVTNTQGVGTEVKLCEAGVSTDVTMESLGKGGGKCRSVGCGDSPVNVIVGALKEVVSHGMVTDPVRGVDLGVMASPQTASQRTNTVLSSVSRFTNTRWAFNTNSSTNTVLNTQEKHTNTAHILTRTVAVGNSRVRDIQAVAKTRSVCIGTSTWAQALPAVAKTTTRDTGVGLANINENYLVGLKTQNIACGPSCLPDPAKTRSIGVAVGEGRIRDDIRPFQTPAQTSQLSPQSQSQLEPGLDHYIEKMQRLLREQQCLLTESYSELGEVFIQPHTNLGTISTQLASTLSCINSAMKQGCAEGCSLTSESRDCGQSQSLSGLSRLIDNSPQSDSERSGVSQPVTKESEDKQKTLMEHQTSSSQHGKVSPGQPTSANILRSIMKKQEGSSGTRKSLKFVGVNAGFEPMSTSEPTSEEASSEEEEKNRNVNRKWREVCGLPDQGRTEPRRDKGVASRDWRGHMKAEIQERFKLSEKMLSACQALRTHLSDDKALPSRELRSCLNTLQHEWFRVSSQKSAVPAVVEDYLSAFRAVSPAVLQHVANMADGNGNTALHYSVSHSNFHVVKRMLGAEVCNVNQQNKAGYTPIMLAALAAVEAPEDMRVVEELFTKGDVNAKASQAGQTALMLAVSHGRMDMVKALLVQGAEVNLQDDEGSTALMCASEHGHAEIVRLLLAQPGCDATLSDSDESTALSVALEAGHKDIAVLLYAHVNFSKGQPGGGTPRLSSKSILNSSGKSVFE